MKKYLRYTGMILGIILLLCLILPYIFKDRIINELKKEMNKNITGKVEFQDASLSLFKNFPKLTLSVYGLNCKSYVTEDTSELFSASEVQLGFNIWSLIREKNQLTIRKIELIKPMVNIIAYDSAQANYNIMKTNASDSSKSPGAFAINIESFIISDGVLTYHDIASGMALELNQLNHKGTYYYSDDFTKISTQTDIREINYQKNKISLINSVQLKSILDLNYDKKQNLFNLTESELNFNNLKLDCKGSIGTNGDSLILALEMKAPDNNFKDLFSLLPHAYIKEYDQVKSNGKFELSLNLNGVYSEKQKIYPSWSFQCNVDNGFLQYPGKPVQLEKCNLDLHSSNTGPTIKNASVILKEFSFLLDKQAFSGNLQLSDLSENLTANGKISGSLNLSALNNFYPMEVNTKISGTIKPDVSFRFSKSAIQNDEYEQIDLSGLISFTNIMYHTSTQPDISILSGELAFKPDQLNINNIVMHFGQSDLSLEGSLIKPLYFLSKEQQVSGHLSASGKLINMKEWTHQDTLKSKLKPPKSSINIPDYISKLNLEVNCSVAQMMYSDYDIKESKANGLILGNTIKINQFTSTINHNQIIGSGSLNNVYSFIMEDKTLNGDLVIIAPLFNADQFMATPPGAAGNKGTQANSSSTGFSVPKNMNLNVGFSSNEVIYKPLKLSSAEGKLHIANSEIQFENMSANLAGGKIALKGLFNTADPTKPYFNFKFDISKLQFSEALSSFASLSKLAPVMNYIQGHFNANLIIEGILGKDMFPVLDKFNADGLFETIDGSIQGFKPLDLLADKLKLNSLKNLNIGNTKNWVTVKNGIVGIKDLNKKIDDIDVNINGNSKISGPMNYQFIVRIPKSRVTKFASALKLDHAVDQLNSILNKTGIGQSVLSNINLLVNLTGMASDPSFSFKLLNDKGDVTSEETQIEQSVKDKLGDTIKSKFESEKNKAATEIKKAEDSLSKQAMKKAGDLKNQVIDQAAKEATKSIDSAIVNKAKDLTKGSLDSLSQKVLNKDAKKEADQIKDKLNEWNPFKKDKK